MYILPTLKESGWTDDTDNAESRAAVIVVAVLPERSKGTRLISSNSARTHVVSGRIFCKTSSDPTTESFPPDCRYFTIDSFPAVRVATIRAWADCPNIELNSPVKVCSRSRPIFSAALFTPI